MSRYAPIRMAAWAGAALVVGLPAFAAFVQKNWSFQRVVNSPPQAGQPCDFKVELVSPTGSLPRGVQVEMTCEQDPALSVVVEPAPSGRSSLAAEFQYTFPADAQGAWKFVFQILENGVRGDRSICLAPIAASPQAGPAPPETPVGEARAEEYGVDSPTPTPLGFGIAPLRPARPDLAATFLDGPQVLIGAPGEKRTLRYRIENLGDAPTTNTLIRYGSNLQASADPVRMTFEPGMRIVGALNFELEPGMSELWVEADARGQADSKTDNNRAARPVRIDVPSPYELSVLGLFLVGEPARIHPGQLLEVQVEIRNPGPANILRPFEVALEGLEKEPIRQIVPPVLAAGETRTVSFQGRAFDDGSGVLALTAIADSGEALQERDETDNFAALDLSSRFQSAASALSRAAPTPAPALPNLSIASAKADGLEPGQYRVEVAIANRGAARSPASALCLEYVDPSLPLAARDVRLEADVPALEAGATAVIARRITYGAPGPFSMTATVNPLPNAIGESSRADNSVQIQAAPPAGTPLPVTIE